MLRQLLTTDALSLRTYVTQARRGIGPKILARLVPGGPLLEVVDAQGHREHLRVKIANNTQWHQPLACYKDEGQ